MVSCRHIERPYRVITDPPFVSIFDCWGRHIVTAHGLNQERRIRSVINRLNQGEVLTFVVPTYKSWK